MLPERVGAQIRVHRPGEDIDIGIDGVGRAIWPAAAEEHDLGDGLQRVVMSDWDADALPARAQVLRLTASGLQRIDLV